MSRNCGSISLAALLSGFGGSIVIFTTITSTHFLVNKFPQSEVLGVFSPSPTPTPTTKPTPTTTPTPTLMPKPTVTPTLKPSPTPTPIPITGEQLEAWFSQYASHYSVDRELLRRIARCESTYKPYAKNGPYSGLYQFNTNTWVKNRKIMNLDSNPELRFNAEESIRTAAFLLSTRGSSAWPNCSK